jgi:hypothetical protein
MSSVSSAAGIKSNDITSFVFQRAKQEPPFTDDLNSISTNVLARVAQVLLPKIGNLRFLVEDPASGQTLSLGGMELLQYLTQKVGPAKAAYVIWALTTPKYQGTPGLDNQVALPLKAILADTHLMNEFYHRCQEAQRTKSLEGFAGKPKPHPLDQGHLIVSPPKSDSTTPGVASGTPPQKTVGIKNPARFLAEGLGVALEISSAGLKQLNAIQGAAA